MVREVERGSGSGMPPGSWLLLSLHGTVFQGIFIKDSNSLAYYNMANGAVIHLALKERGGRKK